MTQKPLDDQETASTSDQLLTAIDCSCPYCKAGIPLRGNKTYEETIEAATMFGFDGKTTFITDMMKNEKGFSPGELVFIPSFSGERKSNMALSLLSKMTPEQRKEYLNTAAMPCYDWECAPTVWPVRDEAAEQRVADMVKYSVGAQIDWAQRDRRKLPTTNTSTKSPEEQMEELKKNPPSALTNLDVRKLINSVKSSVAALDHSLFKPNK